MRRFVNSFIAVLWGFAEATLFFVVVDVFLTDRTIAKGPRAALRFALLALAGAIAGGAVMYVLALRDPSTVHNVLALLAAIDDELIAIVVADLNRDGLMALFSGAFTGKPYKIFAAQAATAGVPLASLLLVTIPARLFRWFLAIAAAAAVGAAMTKLGLRDRARFALAAVWIVFYAVFWSVGPLR